MPLCMKRRSAKKIDCQKAGACCAALSGEEAFGEGNLWHVWDIEANSVFIHSRERIAPRRGGSFMRENVELSRKILFEVEQSEPNENLRIEVPDLSPNAGRELQIEGVSPEEILYHVMILHQNGLIEGRNMDTMGTSGWALINLTAAGRQFLEAVRNDTTWNKVKEAILDAAQILSTATIRAAVLKLLGI
jgi:hypothetical protein